MKSEQETKKDGGRGKRPYSPPTLTVHGDVARLTSLFRLARSKGDFATGPV